MRDVLELVSLGGKEERRPAQLSGGERQRVALARSLVLEPDVLLLDEPLAALDPKLRKQMRGELKAMQRRVGITFLLVTHDQEEALSMSDQLAVMNQGLIEQVGTPEDVYLRPRTRFVAGFLGAVNWIGGVGVRPEATRLAASADGGPQRYAVRTGDRLGLPGRLRPGDGAARIPARTSWRRCRARPPDIRRATPSTSAGTPPTSWCSNEAALLVPAARLALAGRAVRRAVRHRAGLQLAHARRLRRHRAAVDASKTTSASSIRCI